MTYPRSSRLVLVVDDDADLRDTLRVMLNAMGYLVSSAANSGEALLEIGMQRPDVVLTDIYMAGGDGFELINAMRTFKEDIPIIAMSGGGQYPLGLNQLGVAEKLGAAATVAKPFRAAQLVETIDRVVAGCAAA